MPRLENEVCPICEESGFPGRGISHHWRCPRAPKPRAEPQIIRKEVNIYERGMVSGVGQQQDILLWDYVQESDGTYWLWPAEHLEPGSMVHCGDVVRAGRKRSEGYGGRTMQFPTKDGVVELQGPWHSNTDALYERTGVDLRNKHWTWGVVGLERDYSGRQEIYRDILYEDPPTGLVGDFDRVEHIAQHLANELGITVYCYRQSRGGSSSGSVHPKEPEDASKT
jgi:hypothetical protein